MAPQQAEVALRCMSLAVFDFFTEHRKGERNVANGVLSHHPVNYIPENHVVLPPENGVVTFLIIATADDIPNHTPVHTVSDLSLLIPNMASCQFELNFYRNVFAHYTAVGINYIGPLSPTQSGKKGF